MMDVKRMFISILSAILYVRHTSTRCRLVNHILILLQIDLTTAAVIQRRGPRIASNLPVSWVSQGCYT